MTKKGHKNAKAPKEAAQAPQEGTAAQSTEEGGEPKEDRQAVAEDGQPKVGADASSDGRGSGPSSSVSSDSNGGGEAKSTQAVSVKTATTAIATRPGVSEEIAERISEIGETLESFDTFKFPQIKFKEAFTIRDGEDVQSFEGVIVFTKQSNVYYKSRYKAGENRQPDCFSPDGKVPTSPNKVSASCADCPNNQFGSGPDGTGKACKNTRPLFVLTLTDDGSVSAIPKILRVPPTSLPIVTKYITELAADYGAYYGVKTKFEIFKKDEGQSHFNMRFKTAGRLTPQMKVDVSAIRDTVMPFMRSELAVEEEQHEEKVVSQPASAPASAPVDTTRF